jgi:hypothetical protein
LPRPQPRIIHAQHDAAMRSRAVIERIKDAASTTILSTGITGFCGGLGYVTWQHLTGLLA